MLALSIAGGGRPHWPEYRVHPVPPDLWRCSICSLGNTVSMRDVVLQPGAEIPEFAMPNPMLCHVTEGELAIRQDGREFVAKKGDA